MGVLASKLTNLLHWTSVRIDLDYPLFSKGSPMGNNEPKGIPLNKTLFPEHLQSQGYQTHLVGKWAYSNQTFWSIFKHCDTFRWHVGFCKEEYLPQSRGFHSAFGYWGGGIVSFHPKFLVSFVMNFHWLGLLQQNQGEFARFSLEPRCILWQQRIFHGLVQYQDSRDHCWSWPKRPFVYLCCNANTSFTFTSSSGQNFKIYDVNHES